MIARFMAVVAIGLMAAGSATFAQDSGSGAPKEATKPPAMMGMQRGSGMMGGMDQPQMHRMMENCSRMMESRMQPKAPAPDKS